MNTCFKPLNSFAGSKLQSSRGRISRRTTPRFTTTTMAALTAYVKGFPETKTLGDCPFCHRVLLTLEAKSIPYEKEYIDFANKPDWLVEKYGGKVPVINDGGHWLNDSDNIVVYLEEKYPSPSLKSEVPPEIGAAFFGAFRGFLLSTPEETAEKQAKFEAETKLIEDYLASKGPLLGGTTINASDAALAPKLYHAKVTLKHFKGYDLVATFPAIAKYFQTIEATSAWKNTDYGAELIIKGWSKNF